MRFKLAALSMLLNMQLFVEEAVYVAREEIPMSGEDDHHRCSHKDPNITSRYDQPVGTLDLPQKILSVKLLTPKDDGIFTLTSLTNRHH